MESLIEAVKAWGYEEKEIRAYYEKAVVDRVEAYGLKANDQDTINRALSATYMYYKSKQYGTAQRETKSYFVLGFSHPSDIKRTFVEEFIQLYNTDREALNGEKYKKYTFDSEGFPLQESKFKKGVMQRVPVYRRMLVYALQHDKAAGLYKPTVLEIKDNYDYNGGSFILKGSNVEAAMQKLKPFSYCDIETSSYRRSDLAENTIFTAFDVKNIQPASIADTWKLFKYLPSSITETVNNFQKILERNKNLPFNIIGGLVAVKCLITDITLTSSNGYSAKIMDSDGLATDKIVSQVYLYPETDISNRFGDDSEVVIFGSLMKGSQDGEPPHLLAWSVIESADAKKVVPPKPKIKASDVISDEADKKLIAEVEIDSSTAFGRK